MLVFDGWMDSLVCPSQSGGIDLMEGVEDMSRFKKSFFSLFSMTISFGAGLGEDKGASVPRWPRCES